MHVHLHQSWILQKPFLSHSRRHLDLWASMGLLQWSARSQHLGQWLHKPELADFGSLPEIADSGSIPDIVDSDAIPEPTDSAFKARNNSAAACGDFQV